MSRWRRQQRRRARRPWSRARFADWVRRIARETDRHLALEPHPFVPSPGSVAPNPKEFRETLERKIAEVRRLGLGPPLVPPEGVRPVLIATSDPSRFNVVFVKEDNN
jgi:hypothetical protein